MVTWCPAQRTDWSGDQSHRQLVGNPIKIDKVLPLESRNISSSWVRYPHLFCWWIDYLSREPFLSHVVWDIKATFLQWDRRFSTSHTFPNWAHHIHWNTFNLRLRLTKFWFLSISQTSRIAGLLSILKTSYQQQKRLTREPRGMEKLGSYLVPLLLQFIILQLQSAEPDKNPDERKLLFQGRGSRNLHF